MVGSAGDAGVTEGSRGPGHAGLQLVRRRNAGPHCCCRMTNRGVSMQGREVSDAAHWLCVPHRVQPCHMLSARLGERDRVEIAAQQMVDAYLAHRRLYPQRCRPTLHHVLRRRLNVIRSFPAEKSSHGVLQNLQHSARPTRETTAFDIWQPRTEGTCRITKANGPISKPYS